MSLARQRVFAAAPSSLRLLQTASSSSSTVAAVLATRRLLSTTRSNHDINPGLRNKELHSDMKHLHLHRSGNPDLFDKDGRDLNPYKEGPSALNKAVHLFFLTEIMRGTCWPARRSRRF